MAARVLLGPAWLGLALLLAPAARGMAEAPGCPPLALDAFGFLAPAAGLPPVTLWPRSGPAPLHVGVIWRLPSDSPPRLVELDVDGDGVVDIADDRDENLGHVYRQPGRFAATIAVHGDSGAVTRYASPVEVLAPAAFDAEIQARWSALKSALRRGDFAAAVECMHFSARQGAQRSLRLLLRRADRVEAELPPIRFVAVRAATAVYRTLRPRPRQSKPNEVHFAPDLDGVWRVAALYGE